MFFDVSADEFDNLWVGLVVVTAMLMLGQARLYHVTEEDEAGTVIEQCDAVRHVSPPR